MTIDEFAKVELRVAKVQTAERVEGSDKLLRLMLDAGDKNEAGEVVSRQVLAGIGKAYTPEEMVGRQIAIVANLDPRDLMGFTSQGMILAATDKDGRPALVSFQSEIEPGTKLK